MATAATMTTTKMTTREEAVAQAYWVLVDADASEAERAEAALGLSRAFGRGDLDEALRKAIEEEA